MQPPLPPGSGAPSYPPERKREKPSVPLKNGSGQVVRPSDPSEKVFSNAAPDKQSWPLLKRRKAEIFTPETRFTESPHKFQSAPTGMGNWMANVFTGANRHAPLMQCTMIGSHDAASHSLKGFGDQWAITQTNGLHDQLCAGARYLDVRITCNRKGEFIVHHGPVKGGTAQKEVIEPLSDFLKEHPKELVVVKLQFEGVSKEKVTKFLDHDFKSLSSTFALSNRDETGQNRKPGLITYDEACQEGKNLLVLVNDEKLKDADKLLQRELGDNAWLHSRHCIDMWANTPDHKEVRSFSENNVLPVIDRSMQRNEGKLSVLQLQTNIKPSQALKGGMKSVWRLAGNSNHEMTGMVKDWYLQRSFKPNIILQDFIGHFNYQEVAALTIALNSEYMSDDDIKVGFPEIYPDIIALRNELQRVD